MDDVDNGVSYATGRDLEGDILAGAVPIGGIKCGVYFLIRDRRIVYVGRAVHIDMRVASHVWDGYKKFDSWSWIDCQASEQAATERAMINRFMPEYNVDSTTRMLRGERDLCPPAPEDAFDNMFGRISPESRARWDAQREERALAFLRDDDGATG
ncbi:MAG: hypothetical protein P4L90_25855 [Rhodopila sp.]|nr:hypothetical protein [Rhodopila sp.]